MSEEKPDNKHPIIWDKMSDVYVGTGVYSLLLILINLRDISLFNLYSIVTSFICAGLIAIITRFSILEIRKIYSGIYVIGRDENNAGQNKIFGTILTLGMIIQVIILLEMTKYMVFQDKDLITTLDLIKPLGWVLTGVVASTGLYLAYLRNENVLKQIELQDKVHNETQKQSQEQHQDNLLNDLLTKSIENLGHAESSVRYGAIHTLIHVAKESFIQSKNNDQRTNYARIVNDVLCRYITDLSHEYKEFESYFQLSTENGLPIRHKGKIQLQHEINYIATLLFKPDDIAYKLLFLEMDKHLPYAELSEVKLTGAELEDANLNGAILNNAALTGANLSYTNLMSSDLSGADLTGANLSGADLEDADLNGADLLNTLITDAYVGGTILEHHYKVENDKIQDTYIIDKASTMILINQDLQSQGISESNMHKVSNINVLSLKKDPDNNLPDHIFTIKYQYEYNGNTVPPMNILYDISNNEIYDEDKAQEEEQDTAVILVQEIPAFGDLPLWWTIK